MNKNAGTNNHSVTSTRPEGASKYSLCPKCGHKGVYRVKGQYSRCRYCGLYRVLMPESAFKGDRIFLAIVAKQDKRK